MTKKKGKFIVIEGTDGSGKGTQIELLRNYLKGKKKDFEVSDFPQYNNFSGAFVAKYLRGEYGSAEEVGPYRGSIFYAIDRYDKSFDIARWIKEGKIVLSNRYVSANMGHQAGKIDNKKKRNDFLKWLYNLEYDIFNIPKPDVTILLYASPEIGQKLVDNKNTRSYVHGKKRDIHEADLNHLKKASEAYLDVAKKYKWTIIDCTPEGVMRSRESIHEEILKKLHKYL
jgi:dTMP kinase